MRTYEFPGLPPRVNNLYPTNFKTGRRYKDPRAAKWQEMVVDMLSHDECPPIGILSLEIEFYMSCFTKQNTVRKTDVDSRIKALLDAFCKGIGTDDSFVFHMNVKKIESEEERTVVHLHLLDAH